jgi:hypothetical protein
MIHFVPQNLLLWQKLLYNLFGFNNLVQSDPNFLNFKLILKF